MNISKDGVEQQSVTENKVSFSVPVALPVDSQERTH